MFPFLINLLFFIFEKQKATNAKITQAQILQRLIEEKKKEMKDEKKKTVRIYSSGYFLSLLII